ncbi:hypothetical protein [Promicromonospora sukumoe]|uniref:hypothetical protein n=1 Tax=Promicromonospora sukumoe TaxID=88382 RepID=UPI00037D3AED|nr:hypothetical protein [Promicromonospora sukumoe]
MPAGRSRSSGPSRTFGLGTRGPWLGLVAGVAALGAVEVLVLHLVAAALLPRPVALAVDVVAGALTAALLAAFVSPLRSRHRVVDGVARLRLGWVAAVDVVLDDVASATVHRPTAAAPLELGAAFDEDTGRVSLVRATTAPAVLVELSRPVAARVQVLRKVRTTSVLVGVAEPDELLRALAPAPR